MDDCAQPRYRGFGSAGFQFQEALENTSLRSFYKVPPGVAGVVVSKVFPISQAAKVLKAGDVLLALEGQDVADDATTIFRNKER